MLFAHNVMLIDNVNYFKVSIKEHHASINNIYTDTIQTLPSPNLQQKASLVFLFVVFSTKTTQNSFPPLNYKKAFILVKCACMTSQ